MGNDIPHNQQEKNNHKEHKQNNNKIKNEKNNQIDIPKDKKEKIDQKMVINTLMANIQQNSEIDETEELDLAHLDEYVDSIFPSEFPKENIELIRKEIYKIKNLKLVYKIIFIIFLNLIKLIIKVASIS